MTEKAANLIYCCKSVGARIGTRVTIRRDSASLTDVFDDFSSSTLSYMKRKGFEATLVKVLGFYGPRGTELFVKDKHTVAHEAWHKRVQAEGFEGHYGLGYIDIEENMASAVADWTCRRQKKVESWIRLRRQIGPQLLPLYWDVVASSNNGGVEEEQLVGVQSLAKKLTGAKPSNWAAFLNCLFYWSIYDTCSRILEDRGLREGKNLFMAAISEIEKHHDPITGLAILMGADPEPTKDYTKLWVPAFNEGLLSEQPAVDLKVPRGMSCRVLKRVGRFKKNIPVIYHSKIAALTR